MKHHIQFSMDARQNFSILGVAKKLRLSIFLRSAVAMQKLRGACPAVPQPQRRNRHQAANLQHLLIQARYPIEND